MSFYGKQRIPLSASKSYIYSTIAVALLLSLFFSPWNLYFPSWMGWVVAWWSVRETKVMSMSLAMIIGAMLDVLNSAVMGVVMLDFLLLSYTMGVLRYRFEFLSFIWQTVVMTFIFMVTKIPSLLFVALLKIMPVTFSNLITPLLSGLLWVPFVLLVVYPLYRPVHDKLNPHKNI